MTAAEGSFLGLAKQSAFSTPNTTDADFKYMLFRQGSVAANNIIIPLDPEVGGGSINPRAIVKAGVTSGGMLDMIFRPETLGWFLLGATGNVTSTANADINAITSSAGSGAMALAGSTTVTLSAATQLYAYLPVGVTSATTVTVYGTNTSGSSISETFDLSGASATAYDDGTLYQKYTGTGAGTKTFKTITAASLAASVSGGSASIGYPDGSYSHVFKLGADQFDAPYYTLRYSPGNLWGEQFSDCRVAALAVNFAGARFVDGAVQFVGRTPLKVATTTWDSVNKTDVGPQFLASTTESAMELPLGTSASVLSGSFVATSQIPLDEQFVVGNYEPQGVDIVSRSFAVQMNIKVTDGTLYNKMQYDAEGGAAWVANIYKEGNFKLKLASGEDASTIDRTGLSGRKHSLLIAGNGQSGTNANVSWSAAPIALRAGRQIVMQVTGSFHPSPGYDPITIMLTNDKASYA